MLVKNEVLDQNDAPASQDADFTVSASCNGGETTNCHVGEKETRKDEAATLTDEEEGVCQARQEEIP